MLELACYRTGIRKLSTGVQLLARDQATLSADAIGALVRERRQANDLTQRELSELAGVGLRLVSELERGKVTLRTDAVNRVLAVFGLMLGAIASPRIPEVES